jgi:hypothetical protein
LTSGQLSANFWEQKICGRYAYGANIDYGQLKFNLDRARKIYSNLEKEIET